jgi:probable addiction module antidote protein
MPPYSGELAARELSHDSHECSEAQKVARPYPIGYRCEMMKTTYAVFDPADYLDNDEVIAEYLSAAVEDPNPDVFLAALGDVAKARGMAKIAKDAGLGRESLYKALEAGAHPRYETITAVLRALGVRFAVVADGPRSK